MEHGDGRRQRTRQQVAADVVRKMTRWRGYAASRLDSLEWTKESTARERLDMLQRRGESGGRGIDEVVATTRSDDEEKERGEREGGMVGLGFV